MSLIVDLIFSVFGLLASVALAFACVIRWPAARTPRAVLAAVILGYTLASTWIVAYGIERVLVITVDEPVHVCPAAPVVIVVLAAGSVAAANWSGDRIETITLEQAARVAEGLRIYRLCEDARIVSSGGSAWHPARSPDSVLMRDALVAHGVRADHIVLESQSSSTRDQAVRVAPLLGPLGARRVILVTSAVHMPRSLAAFRGAGIDAMPSMARNPQLRLGPRQRFLPSADGLEASRGAAHEVIGFVYYFARGWTR